MKADEAYQCGKCGLCLTSCPVYRVTREETTAPRAKVHLIRSYAESRLPDSDRMQDKLQCCLMCGTCTAMCPGGVSHDALFMRMRAEMAGKRGRSVESRALGAILPREGRLRMATKAARIGTSSLAQRILGRMRIGNIPVENFPVPNRIPFRDQVPETLEPEGQAAGTVAYFTGCATNYIFEKTGHAVTTVLRRMGYRVRLPGGQRCCGLPLFFHGNVDGARENALNNIAALKDAAIDAVIVDCATCGSALGHIYPQLMREMDLPAADAESIAARVWDAGEFIAAHADRLEPHLNPAAKMQPATYHLPCHLKNHGKGKNAVADLLQRLPGVDFRQTPDWDVCCGGGGLFFNEFPEISAEMVEKKIANALASGAAFWATGCPGCRVQLSGNLPKTRAIELCHPVEIVANAIL